MTGEGDLGGAVITDTPIAVSEADLADLRRRLSATRWPEPEPVDDWSQGAPLERVRALCDHWLHRYDWRRCEAMLNGWHPQATTIDGLAITFFHIRSVHPGALPMIMTHGWPGSVVEFDRVVGPLTDPLAHGGDVRDAFHLVLPCLPGYGFSAKPAASGWTVDRIAAAWATLMARLGYEHWVAQGGDWGASVTGRIAAAAAPGCAAIHLNTVNVASDAADADDDSAGARRARAAGMRGVDTARSGRRGVGLDAAFAELLGEALPPSKQIIPVRMEAAPIEIATCDREVNVGMIAIDVKTGNPRPVRKLFACEVQGRRFQTVRIGPRRHREDHRYGRRTLASGVPVHLEVVPILRENLHVPSVAQHDALAGFKPEFLVGTMPQPTDIGEVGKDVSAAMLTPRDPHHNLWNST